MKKITIFSLLHIFVAVFVISAGILFSFPAGSIEDYNKNRYEDTQAFENKMLNEMNKIKEQIFLRSNLETNGKYDPNKLVDIQDYYETGRISGENESDLVYKLGDLIEWSQGDYMAGGPVYVCEKSDGQYVYLSQEEFDGQTSQGYQISGEKVINEQTGEIVYESYWQLSGNIQEKYKTVNGKTLFELANEKAEWNGNLHQLYEYLTGTLSNLSYLENEYHVYQEQGTIRNTNLSYAFWDYQTEVLYTNVQGDSNIDRIAESIKESGKYVLVAPKRSKFETNLAVQEFGFYPNTSSNDYLFVAGVDTSYPVEDAFYVQNQLFEKVHKWLFPAILAGILSVIGGIVCFLWITVLSGHDTKGTEIRLNWFDKWKTEPGLIGILLLWAIGMIPMALGIEAVTTVYRQGTQEHINLFCLFSAAIAVIVCFFFMTGYLSLVRRIKAKVLWKNSYFRTAKVFLCEVWKNKNCVYKTALWYAGLVLFHWYTVVSRVEFFLILMLAMDVLTGYFLIRKAMEKKKLKEGIERIADGNVQYQIPTDELHGEEHDMAVCINRVGEGLQKAVEKSMKDERLKADLITNVSHDIKTPLTSIINYVELLKREKIQDEKIQGYIKVLEEKSQRLKHLTEDVVEASKISSGNISMELSDIDFVEMIHQTAGEVSEKFEKRNLQFIKNIPEHPIYIRADGRRIWRVLENIYNNAAKYAMEGTRVYADLREGNGEVFFSLKNISEQPLNISADELTERFIRGDVSRSTEGSGLGLSIAKNLTQIQGGTFEVYLDGDLFKVTLSFKIIQKSNN